MSTEERVQRVRERIAEACARTGRSQEEVTLVAVTKTVSAAVVTEALAAGVTDIGENRVQEAAEKFPELAYPVRRHLIGHLQTNKVRHVSKLFDLIHSVDRRRLVDALSKRAQSEGCTFECLIQVNVAGEESKYGVSPAAAPGLVAHAGAAAGVEVKGLMTIAPYETEEGELRRIFGGLRELSTTIRKASLPGVSMEHLSMGMSNDFEVAVEEGATLVRVGSAIFGPRSREE